MTVSGTYAYDPTLADITITAFGRIGVRPAAITVDHMLSARRNTNLVLVRFANRGVNLWAVDEQVVLLNENQVEYAVPANTVMMLDTWVRQYQFLGEYTQVPAIGTTLLSTSVLVTLANHGLSVGNYVIIPIYTSLGGIVLQGTYQVVTVPSTSTFTVTAANAATATLSGGAVPYYTANEGSELILVTLNDHGFVSGDTFTVHTQLTVGGVSLSGEYPVTVNDANSFYLTPGQTAGATESAYENNGNMLISPQAPGVAPLDRIMYPLSRTEYAQLPNKFSAGSTPTTYWFDRTDPPSVKIWQPSNGTITQELHYYRMRQLMDADPSGTQTPDIPYRFEETLCANLAFLLSMEWSPDKSDALKTYADETWTEAAHEDRERVVLDLTPNVSAYFR